MNKNHKNADEHKVGSDDSVSHVRKKHCKIPKESEISRVFVRRRYSLLSY